MQHHAHRLAVRYPNQRLAGQNFLHRHQAAGSGCAGQSLRSGPQAQCVHANVRWGHKRSLQDGRSCRWHLGGHMPHESLAQVRRQSHRDREPLSGFGDTIRMGELHVPDEPGLKLSRTPVSIRRNFGAQHQRRRRGHLRAENVAPEVSTTVAACVALSTTTVLLITPASAITAIRVASSNQLPMTPRCKWPIPTLDVPFRHL